jgi:hypothetical protein
MAPAPAFSFDGKNPKAQQVAERTAAAAVVDISKQVEAAIRAVVVKSIRTGIPVYDAARLIESTIGLDERRAGALDTYRTGLVNDGLSFDRINTLTDRYADRLLRSRANTIARTEIMGALNAGNRAANVDAQAGGLLSKAAVKEWLTTDDEKTCPVCEPLDGVQVPLRAMFPTSVGPLPGPPAHPNCRCAQAVTEPDR